eukprot:scaffold50751_cov39-Cyclotella_meneghiniana.AAC.2
MAERCWNQLTKRSELTEHTYVTVDCRQVSPLGGTQSRLAWPGRGEQPKGCPPYGGKHGCMSRLITPIGAG